MSGQNEFWLAQQAKWPEIGQWPAAISSSAQRQSINVKTTMWKRIHVIVHMLV